MPDSTDGRGRCASAYSLHHFEAGPNSKCESGWVPEFEFDTRGREASLANARSVKCASKGPSRAKESRASGASPRAPGDCRLDDHERPDRGESPNLAATLPAEAGLPNGSHACDAP